MIKALKDWVADWLPWFGIVLILLPLFVWYYRAWYRYPCGAFKSGFLAGGYAPARCIK